MKIDSFKNDYFFLSNFYEAEVTYDGYTYQSSEAAFQAQKCKNPKDREKFTHMTPSEAKKAGRSLDLRPDWEEVKYDIMHDIVLAKFREHSDLREKLLATYDAELEEGNTWGDCVWGTVEGVGDNYLGKILMDVREGFRKEQ